MAKKALTKFTLNSKGIAALLKSSEVQREVKSRADRIAGTAGEGYEADLYIGRTRARAGVIAVTPEAMNKERKHRTLTRAFDAGR